MLKLSGGDIPDILRAIPDAPKTLYASNDRLLHLLDEPRLAVVGTRNTTPYGRTVTESLVSELASSGIVIISGLALGVDSIAHKATLKAKGTTIAVLPGSINKIYPRSHETLAKQINESGGVLISEKDDTKSLRAYDFLTRNRLISGLSDAVLITEAAERSGSLNTARHALEQGKTIFSVPGNINNLYSQGTNNLIKMGAHLVSCVKDIYSVMGWELKKESSEEPLDLPEPQMKIYRLIHSGISSGEELLIKSGLTSRDFTEALTMLEIENLIAPIGANHWIAK